MFVRKRLWCATAVIALSVTALSTAAAASAQTGQVGRIPIHHAISYEPTPRLSGTGSALPGGLATFTATATDGTSKFTYTQVGKNPAVKTTTPATTVQTQIVPLKMVVRGKTFDPTVGNSCDATSALSRTVNSPIFKAAAWTFGSTAVGAGQYVDAFRRAEFWTSTNPAGVNPGYHVTLSPTVLATITINVPNTKAGLDPAPCGSLGLVESKWLENYLQTKVLPGLASSGVKPSTFPFFVTGNVVEFGATKTDCCILGYHSAMNTTAGVQTYGIADYENSGGFGSSERDVEAASHEVAEWMDDPTGTNPTKPWGHTGQVTNCQSNLEVGDPLTEKTITRTVGTFTYHVQELAFFSWFYHSKSSLGVNGWFSDNGTFKTSAAPCS